MTNNTPASYFERAKAIQGMILAAQEDLRQLREDAIAELIDDSTSKEAAKEIRKDLAEVFAVAKIAAKGDIEERNQAAKMARRKRIAEECGVQLELLPDVPAEPARRMARAAGKAAAAKGARGKGLVGQIHDKIVEAGMIHEGGNSYRVPEDHPIARNGLTTTIEMHDPETGEIDDADDEEDPGFAPAAEPAALHANTGGVDLTDIPAFLRRC